MTEITETTESSSALLHPAKLPDGDDRRRVRDREAERKRAEAREDGPRLQAVTCPSCHRRGWISSSLGPDRLVTCCGCHLQTAFMDVAGDR
jgi:hypothetical protein